MIVCSICANVIPVNSRAVSSKSLSFIPVSYVTVSSIYLTYLPVTYVSVCSVSLSFTPVSSMTMISDKLWTHAFARKKNTNATLFSVFRYFAASNFWISLAASILFLFLENFLCVG